MKPNKIQAALIIALMMLCSNTTFAQLYKTDFTTKISLTGSTFPGSLNAITLKAPDLTVGGTNPWTLTLPGNAGTTGYVLTTDGTGITSWTNPLTAIILAGDVVGPAGTNKVNSVQLAAGPTIALAINNNPVGSLNGNEINHDVTLTTGAAAPFALGINLANPNTWTALQTFTSSTTNQAVNITNTSNLTGNNGIALTVSTTGVGGSSGSTALQVTQGNVSIKAGNVGIAAGSLGVGGKTVISQTQDVSATTFSLNAAVPNFTVSATGLTTITGGSNFKYVDGHQTAGFVLTEDAAGVATWTDPGLSVNLLGDVTGPANNTKVVSVQTAAGPSIATAINTNPAGSLNGNVVSHDVTLTTGASSPFALGINTANPNTWTGVQTFPNASITNAELANSTIGFTSTGSLNVPATIALGASGAFDLNLNNPNNWNATQTISGAGNSLTVASTADLIVSGHGAAVGNILTSDATGKASWTSLSSVGVTSVQGTTDEVIVNADLTNATHTGAIVLTTPQPIGTTSSPTFSGMTLTSLTQQPGVVHNSGAGVLSSSAIVDGDIAANTITNGRLVNSTIAFSSPNSTLNVPATIALGAPAGAFDLNLNNPNNWNATQTISGAGNSLTVASTADLIVSGHGAAVGFVLTSDASGKASWTDPGLSVNLLGDVTGPANNTKVVSVQTAAGPSIATAINTNPAGSLNGNVVSHDVTLTTGASSPFALGINTANPNTWTGVQTFPNASITNAELANSTIAFSSPNSTLNVPATIALGAPAGAFDLNLNNPNNWNATQTISGAGNSLTVASTADLIVSGHGAAVGFVLTSDASGKASWTDPGLSVNLLGDVTGPANNTKVVSVQLNAGPSIALAINNNTAPSINGQQVNHDATLAITGNQLGINTANPNTWTGTQEFGATAQTPGTVAAAAILAISGSNTLFKINSGAGPVNGMTAGTDGRNVTLTNTTANYIVLNSNAGGATQFLIPGGDPVIMGPSATVMLQYDLTAGGWRVIGGF